MFNKFDMWQYRDVGGNCWDFVRAMVKDMTGVELLKSDILPKNKKGMTRDAKKVLKNCIECAPRELAFACHYHKKTLIHVGLIYKGKVRHTGSKIGNRIDSLEDFELMSTTTRYFIHKDLMCHRS